MCSVSVSCFTPWLRLQALKSNQITFPAEWHCQVITGGIQFQIMLYVIWRWIFAINVFLSSDAWQTPQGSKHPCTLGKRSDPTNEYAQKNRKPMTDWIMWVGCKLEVICTPFLSFVLSLSLWTLYCYLSLFFLSLQSKTGALEGPEVDGLIKDMMGLVRVRRYAAGFWHLDITVLYTCCSLQDNSICACSRDFKTFPYMSSRIKLSSSARRYQ